MILAGTLTGVQSDIRCKVLAALTVLLMIIVTTLCTKDLIVKQTGTSRFLEKKINCMLLG